MTDKNSLPARAARMYAAYLTLDSELDQSSADRIGEDSVYTAWNATREALTAFGFVIAENTETDTTVTRPEAIAAIACLMLAATDYTPEPGCVNGTSVSTHRGPILFQRPEPEAYADGFYVEWADVEGTTTATRESVSLPEAARIIHREALSLRVAMRDIAEAINDRNN